MLFRSLLVLVTEILFYFSIKYTVLGIHINIQIPDGREPGFSQCSAVTGQEAMGTHRNTENSVLTQDFFSFCILHAGSLLEQITHGEGSITHGDTQNSSGRGAGHPAVGDAAGEGGWTAWSLEVPINLSCSVNTSGFCNVCKNTMKSSDAKTTPGTSAPLCKPIHCLASPASGCSGSVRVTAGTKTILR